MAPTWLRIVVRVCIVALLLGLVLAISPDLIGAHDTPRGVGLVAVLVPATIVFGLNRHLRRVGVHVHEQGLSFSSDGTLHHVVFADVVSCVSTVDGFSLHMRSGARLALPAFAYKDKDLRDRLTRAARHVLDPQE